MIRKILAFLIAYGLGNFASATILGKVAIGKDIRTMGSGNSGTTNAFRVLGPKLGALTFVLDFFKGAFAVWLGQAIAGSSGANFALLGVVLGHIWPVAFKFKGGKGIATAAGALAMINSKYFFSLLAIFFVAFLLTRTVSVGSIAAAISAVVLSFVIIGTEDMVRLIIIWIIVAIVLGKHLSNIKRLIRGEEKPINFKRKLD